MLRAASPHRKSMKPALRINLYLLLLQRRMTLTDLSERVGISLANLSILKCGKARAIRFSTLLAICDALDCQPGDLMQIERPLRSDGANAPAP